MPRKQKLDQLEIDFFNVLAGYEYDPKATDDFTEMVIIDAKAAASLCREKAKEVIKLARDCWSEHHEIKFEYTEQEILDTLNKKP